MKLLWSLAVLAAVWWMARSVVRRMGSDSEATPPASPPPSPTPPDAMAMVRCAHCGLHLPLEEALEAGGRHFCCAAHRDAGPSPEHVRS